MKTIECSSTTKSAVIKSDCGKHRFVLSRIWDESLPIGAFLCANPSQADEIQNDTTVFKCGNLAANWGWGGFHILNLYPNYSTNPSGVIRNSQADALNEQYVRKTLVKFSVVVLACGNNHEARLADLIRNVSPANLYCLRRNKGGGYLHPARINPGNFPQLLRAFDEI